MPTCPRMLATTIRTDSDPAETNRGVFSELHPFRPCAARKARGRSFVRDNLGHPNIGVTQIVYGKNQHNGEPSGATEIRTREPICAPAEILQTNDRLHR